MTWEEWLSNNPELEAAIKLQDACLKGPQAVKDLTEEYNSQVNE